MSDLAAFRAQLEHFGSETVPETVREFKNDIALTAHEVVVMATPAKSGNTRANVRLTVGPAPDTTSDAGAMDPGGAATLAAGRAALEASADPWAPVWITGNSFKFRWLNNGTKRGMIGRHMIEAALSRVAQQFG